MSKLFSPITIGGLELKNRVVMSPMCQYSADHTGLANEWHHLHYASRAVGGVGLIIVEATAVQENGRISGNDLGIWNETQEEALRELVQSVHRNGAKIGIQLAHAGRKAQVNGHHDAPSAIPFSPDYETPEALSESGIAEVVQNFQLAAERAKRAGFDLIELHAAHGYLINEFLSPLANQRDDQYGGSVQNRFRFLDEIILAVKKVWTGPLFVRVSAEEYAEGGNHINDTVLFAKLLKQVGVHLIDVSSGAVVPFPISDYPGYQVGFSELVKREAGIATAAVGKITTPELAEEILQNGRADLVCLGRELLRHPYWALHAADSLREQRDVPTQYKRAF